MPALPLTAVFADLPDPRRDTQNKLHRLADILSITTCAVIGGAETWEAIAEYGRTKSDAKLTLVSAAVIAQLGDEVMLGYKAGYKFVDGGVHAQVLDFPAAITCGADLAEARRLLAVALIDVAETCVEQGQPLPRPNPLASDAEMDLEEPIYLHLRASTEVAEVPAGVVVP